MKNIANKYSKYNRERKWKIFIDRFNLTSNLKISDVGFSEMESENCNLIEKIYPYPENLTALGIDKSENFLIRYPKVKAVSYDGNKFPFADK